MSPLVIATNVGYTKLQPSQVDGRDHGKENGRAAANARSFRSQSLRPTVELETNTSNLAPWFSPIEAFFSAEAHVLHY